VVAAADAASQVPPLALGAGSVAAFDYRKRAGHDAFRRAREAEAAGQWGDVVARCREALAADPLHLDAAYLLAVALAKTDGAPREIVELLSRAVGGDFIKWGAAVLVQPALQPVLASPLGREWQERVESARREMQQILAVAIIVSAGGDLYAVEGPRWFRVTRTGGSVLGALRVSGVPELAYVTAYKKQLGIGVVDLAALRSKKIVYVPDPVRIAYEARTRDAFLVYTAKAWAQLEETVDTLSLRSLPKTERAGYPPSLADGATLDVRARRVTYQRLATPHVTADYDEHRLASTLRIDTTRRVINVPSPGLVFGDTIAMSPDGSQVAFVAQLADECTNTTTSTAVYLADASTGAPRELERATGGMAVEWIAERTLAIAGDHGVAIYTLDGSAPRVIPGADGLVAPKKTPCVAPVAEPPAAVEDEQP